VLFLQLLVNGLAAGALYALMAVGFALIYNATRMLHLAHGAVFAFGGYALYVFKIKLGLHFVMALALAVPLTALFGMLSEILVYRPLRRRGSSHAAILIASIGILTLFQALFALTFGTTTLNMHQGALATFEVGGLVLTELHVMAAAASIIIFPLLQWFLVGTRYGRALRALADNPRLAVVYGIDTERFYLVIFALGSALAGVSVSVSAYDIGVRPEMGFSIMFVALIAVIVGGIGYLPGAAAGGVLLGLLQNLSLWPLSSQWQEVVLFGALIAFLVFRPQGIFGHMQVTRRA
jgi:branched-chain amino acid transport system permease protein